MHQTLNLNISLFINYKTRIAHLNEKKSKNWIQKKILIIQGTEKMLQWGKALCKISCPEPNDCRDKVVVPQVVLTKRGTSAVCELVCKKWEFQQLQTNFLQFLKID